MCFRRPSRVMAGFAVPRHRQTALAQGTRRELATCLRHVRVKGRTMVRPRVQAFSSVDGTKVTDRQSVSVNQPYIFGLGKPSRALRALSISSMGSS